MCQKLAYLYITVTIPAPALYKLYDVKLCNVFFDCSWHCFHKKKVPKLAKLHITATPPAPALHNESGSLSKMLRHSICTVSIPKSNTVAYTAPMASANLMIRCLMILSFLLCKMGVPAIIITSVS